MDAAEWPRLVCPQPCVWIYRIDTGPGRRLLHLGGICDVYAQADDRIVGTTELVVDHGQSFRVTREDGNARVCVTQSPSRYPVCRR